MLSLSWGGRVLAPPPGQGPSPVRSLGTVPAAGEMVERERDKTVELEFNRLLDSVSHLSHHLHVDQLGGKPLSLGQALELVIE